MGVLHRGFGSTSCLCERNGVTGPVDSHWTGARVMMIDLRNSHFCAPKTQARINMVALTAVNNFYSNAQRCLYVCSYTPDVHDLLKKHIYTQACKLILTHIVHESTTRKLPSYLLHLYNLKIFTKVGWPVH